MIYCYCCHKAVQGMQKQAAIALGIFVEFRYHEGADDSFEGLSRLYLFTE